ncbi:hypothetical protein BH11PAT4_BH11PAT4_3360 [soil metagenome]
MHVLVVKGMHAAEQRIVWSAALCGGYILRIKSVLTSLGTDYDTRDSPAGA